jgi:hypothetical protein
MTAWTLTVRVGSEVTRRKFDDLDETIAEARRQTEEIIADGPLGTVKAIRDYEPVKLVKARLEISGKGLLRPPTAGLDIHGDLSLTGFRGGVARKPFEASGERDIFTEIRNYLTR